MLRQLSFAKKKIIWTSAVAILLGLAACGGGGGGGNPAAPSSTGAPSSPSTPAPSTPSSPATPPESNGKELPVIQLLAGGVTIYAEVADSEDEREKGLMNRQQLAANDGMLFVFSAPTDVWMWMDNTYIPLSVAFIDQNGVIINIEDMQPLTTNRHYSQSQVPYALEMNQGWFAQNNVLPGSIVQGLPRLP